MSYLHDYLPALNFGARILPSEIVGGGLGFTGNTFYVKPLTGSDANNGGLPSTAFKTLGAALNAATANNGDVVYFIAEGNASASATDYQSTAFDWNKDGVHLIGVNNGSMLGQRSRIACLSSIKTIENLFTVSANNCLIANIEVYYGVASTTCTAGIAMKVSGQRNRFVNCQISGIGDSSLDDAGARSLLITGSENIFQYCYIGLDTIIRGTALCEVEILGTAGAPIARTIFEDCVVSSYTSLSTFKAIKSTYLDRFLILKNCILTATQNITSAVAPTGAIINTTPNGTINMLGSGVFGYAAVSTLDDTKILALTYAGIPGSSGANLVGIAQGIDTV